jgi:hypothetical protein
MESLPQVGDKFKYISPYSGLSQWVDEISSIGINFIVSKKNIMYPIKQIKIIT